MRDASSEALLVTLGDRDPLAGREADPLGERPRNRGLPQAKALAMALCEVW